MEQKELLEMQMVLSLFLARQFLEGHFLPSWPLEQISLCVVVVCDIIYTHASSKTCSNCSIIHFRSVLY